MAKNDTWSWDKHKYKAKEWVKGSWKYIYNTAKKTNNKAKETTKEVSSKVSNLKDNTKDIIDKAKDYISDKFENTKDKKDIDTSVNATYIKTKDKFGVTYSYKYTDLISDLAKDNPIPTAIVTGLSMLTGTSLAVSLGITIYDLITFSKNEKNEQKAYEEAKRNRDWNEYQQQQYEKDQAKREQKKQQEQESREKYEEFIKENIKNLNESDKKFSDVLTLNQFNILTEKEQKQYIKDHPQEYSIMMAKYDNRKTDSIEMTSEEANEKESRINPGFWVESFESFINDYDENCWICTMAYSEQRKGNDYYPDDELDKNGKKYELYEGNIAELYDNPNIITFGYDDPIKDGYVKDKKALKRLNNNITYSKQEAQNIIDTMLYTYPEGSFGNMSVIWKDGGGGHSLFWEIKDDEVVIRDTQLDMYYYSENSINKSINYGLTDHVSLEDLIMDTNLCSIFRTDNVDLKQNSYKYLKDKPDYDVSDAEYYKDLFRQEDDKKKNN